MDEFTREHSPSILSFIISYHLLHSIVLKNNWAYWQCFTSCAFQRKLSNVLFYSPLPFWHCGQLQVSRDVWGQTVGSTFYLQLGKLRFNREKNLFQLYFCIITYYTLLTKFRENIWYWMIFAFWIGTWIVLFKSNFTSLQAKVFLEFYRSELGCL